MNAVVAMESAPAQLGYRLLRIAAERFGSAPDQLSEDQSREVQRIASNEQQLEDIVLASPEARQVSVPHSQVELAQAQIRERYESEQDFEDALAAMDMSEEDLNAAVARSLRVDAVLELVGSQAPQVNETDARLYYYMHPEKFDAPERRSARHILITVNDELEGNDSATALHRAQGISKRLQKAPKRFAEQALKHSECPTGLNGGVLGDVHKGVLFPELEQALFAMKAGEVSAPVESELGWHVLMCDSVSPAGQIPLDQALEKLTEMLQDKEVRNVQRKWLAQQANAANAQADD